MSLIGIAAFTEMDSNTSWTRCSTSCGYMRPGFTTQSRRWFFQAMCIPVKYLFPKRFLRKFYRRFVDGQSQVKPMYEDKKDGAIFLMAQKSLFMAWVFYACSICLLILGFFAPVYLTWTRSHHLGKTATLVIFILIFSLPLGLVLFLSYHYPYTNGQHVEYFYIFEKESAEWYRKWKWITISFCGSSILFLVLAISWLRHCVTLNAKIVKQAHQRPVFRSQHQRARNHIIV